MKKQLTPAGHFTFKYDISSIYLILFLSYGPLKFVIFDDVCDFSQKRTKYFPILRSMRIFFYTTNKIKCPS